MVLGCQYGRAVEEHAFVVLHQWAELMVIHKCEKFLLCIVGRILKSRVTSSQTVHRCVLAKSRSIDVLLNFNFAPRLSVLLGTVERCGNSQTEFTTASRTWDSSPA